MSTKDLGWIAAGALVGAFGGAAWGWLGSGGYEAGDSAIGTGFLGGVLGCLAVALLRPAANWRERRRRRTKLRERTDGRVGQ